MDQTDTTGDEETRTILGTGKFHENGSSIRATVPKEGVEEDPLLDGDSEVAYFKEGDGRIVIEPVEQPLR